ncbi:DUF1127 domain-containing protein [Acuticoccus sp. I52.16.1]|uniref:DUF1127 domain-containing protein n=1 Tax=Acuticoccus sp. I52.16.1 TaxID=2928472 RepID=UPI001FCFA07D|nr:DUF1127 domain-containing protein [Acuticoccus sp. I52.16.1]UOM34096.1 DUF1127 domain-containing protein [Acuticoccus sp. I52.16.1]
MTSTDTGPRIAVFAANRHAAPPGPAQPFWRLADRLATYLTRRREYGRLLDMPDYLLTDVGLTRAQIAEIKRDLRP